MVHGPGRVVRPERSCRIARSAVAAALMAGVVRAVARVVRAMAGVVRAAVVALVVVALLILIVVAGLVVVIVLVTVVVADLAVVVGRRGRPGGPGLRCLLRLGRFGRLGRLGRLRGLRRVRRCRLCAGDERRVGRCARPLAQRVGAEDGPVTRKRATAATPVPRASRCLTSIELVLLKSSTDVSCRLLTT